MTVRGSMLNIATRKGGEKTCHSGDTEFPNALINIMWIETASADGEDLAFNISKPKAKDKEARLEARKANSVSARRGKILETLDWS